MSPHVGIEVIEVIEKFEENEENVVRGSRVLDRVFVPVDYTMSSHRALGVALELMRTHGSDVCVFHAQESAGSDDWLGGIGSPSVGGDWVSEALARLRRFLENVAPGSSSRVEVMAKVGESMPTIRRAAQEWGASLIVAPADVHARIFRSPAEHLVHESDIPVLVIPNDE
jgi:nucleotide-binding universal stress UspA family protein